MPSCFRNSSLCPAQHSISAPLRGPHGNSSASSDTVAAIQAEIDGLVFLLYGLDDADHSTLTATCTTGSIEEADIRQDEDAVNFKADDRALTADLVSYLIGTVFGRWDIRFAAGNRQAAEMLDPFAPLPVCTPGMLQNEQGLPLTKEDVQNLQAAGQWHYPLEIPLGWNPGR